MRNIDPIRLTGIYFGFYKVKEGQLTKENFNYMLYGCMWYVLQNMQCNC